MFAIKFADSSTVAEKLHTPLPTILISPIGAFLQLEQILITPTERPSFF